MIRKVLKVGTVGITDQLACNNFWYIFIFSVAAEGIFETFKNKHNLQTFGIRKKQSRFSFSLFYFYLS